MKSVFDYKLEKAKKDKAELAKQYNVPLSSIVWAGDTKYIIVKDDGEIRIGF